MKYKSIHDINTYQCHRNEVYLSGKDEYGKDITLVREIGEDENLKQSSQHLNN